MAGRGGKRIGAGRKPKREEEDLEAFWKRAMSTERREAVVERLYDIQMGENLKAAVTAGALLLAYAMGKPKEKHEHSNPDGSALLQPIAEALTKVYGPVSSTGSE